MKPSVGDALAAGAVAAVVAGVPSTTHALLRGHDVLEASRAAGTILLRHERRTVPLLGAAAAAHAALSLGWALVLSVALPRRRPYTEASFAALAIAALDLGVIGRRLPRIRALPLLPQVADHLAYTWTVVAVLNRRLGRAAIPPSPCAGPASCSS
jgi:hypothetical protein